MPVKAVLGAQWGDEGKGKIVDYLAQEADVCIRFSGGDNAGHTVGEFKLHLVPCGIFNPQTICIIGNGVAVNPESLTKEMAELESRGVSCSNLLISSKAHLIMPWHIILDDLQEKERGKGRIGTTKRGIGPVFADKISRYGFRMSDLMSEDMNTKLWKLWDRQMKIISKVYNLKNSVCYDSLLKELIDFKERIAPLITEAEQIIWKACDEKKRILMEGAQGALLDPDFGSYPQTTSSSCILAGALQGSGISWKDINEVIGVVKAYVTRVCDESHLFLTEMPAEIGNFLREQAGEYGATTGRPRRMGWLSIPDLRYAARLNGFTSLAVTRMDNFGALSKVKVCTGYRKNGQPVYYQMPAGWGSDINHRHAKDYLKVIENLVGTPIKYVSYGPGRDRVIVCRR